MIAELEQHAPYVALIALVLLVCIVGAIEAVREILANRRARRDLARAYSTAQAAHADAIQRGTDAGWHDAPGERRWIS